MNKGRLLAAIITVATVTFVVIGTLWPNSTAIALAGGNSLLQASSTPEEAVTNLAHDIGRQAWEKAYSSLGNKG